MEITDPKFPYQLIVEQTRNRALESLRPGQVLRARVVSPTREGQASLRVAGSELLARTNVALEAGDKLLLKVIRPADPLQLQLIRDRPNDNSVANAMRVALPRETPVSALMNQLRSLVAERPLTPPASTPPERGETSGQPRIAVAPLVSESALPPLRGTPHTPTSRALEGGPPPSPPSLFHSPGTASISKAIEGVLGQQINGAEALSPEQLRRAFLASGLFFESTLATQGTLANDLKGSLLQLLLQLRTHLDGGTPPGAATGNRNDGPQQSSTNPLQGLLSELVSRTEGALARVLLNQLASLPQAESSTQHWHFDLPLANNERLDYFRVKIAGETGRESQQTDSRWTVAIEFELEPLGPVKANLVLRGNEISSFFTAERPEGAQRIKRAMPLLNQAFQRAGLTVGRLVASEGKVEIRPVAPYPLLDEKA
ncbi:MAG: flagellar hook-length control protein FliK [Gammaproteobacteria bacterium]|nr:flagellar hook-length control protein FliK [Gammaproteobacteria bacterium]